MVKKVSLMLMILGAFGFFILTGCEDDDSPTSSAPAELEYIGSDACAECHEAISDKITNNGHGYKLNKVENGQAPSYPYTNVPTPPVGYDWDDISYVIGGFGWKARFVDLQGYIITGDAVQYNIETSGWSGYHSDEDPGTKPYNCGRCHTTGWKSTDDGGAHQDGMPGMAGQFSEPGVHCEACHGRGSRHVESSSADDIVRDTNSSMCGGCHYRNENHLIDASGGFIRHHEQYDEMISGGHRGLDCIECHDPHQGIQDPSYSYAASLAKCQECHTGANYAMHNGADCIKCHMPEATKSAVASNVYNGDLMTHIFAINTEAVGKDAMWYSDGKKAVGEVTLDFVCYQCHQDPDGVGGAGSPKTLEELSAKATGYHTP
ncbi:MAG: hypothetical protein HN356_07660 [Calditrichaeota bacterium]|jgi:hypothetical protein|nr:hypothetical protein [Calditrichota bacterium]MBT7617510.1 hypothetical protein [Calditrichota bacterium]MBT7787912.1 hypothetical protein [Calditrichota bacterium]